MLFERPLAGNRAVSPGTGFSDIPGLSMKFSVLEDVMIADCVFGGVFRSLAAGETGRMRLTFYLNGVDVVKPNFDEGIVVQQLHENWYVPISMRKRLTLAQGEYTLSVRWWFTGTAAPGPPSGQLRGAEFPTTLSVILHTHTQTLGHGVESKTQGIY